MKSLITLFFNGDLIDHPKENLKLVIWINEHKFPIEKISRQIALWDKSPFIHQCKIHLALYDCTNLNKGILSSRKEVEEMPLLGEHRFMFGRYLNDKIRVYPNVELSQKGPDLLINHTIECSTSGFPLLQINPLLMESSLSAISVDRVTVPIEISLYFEDFNVKQIYRAQENGTKIVYLLRIVNIIGTSDNKVVVYYQSYVKKTASFPVIENTDQKNVDQNVDIKVDQDVKKDPQQVDLITFE